MTDYDKYPSKMELPTINLEEDDDKEEKDEADGKTESDVNALGASRDHYDYKGEKKQENTVIEGSEELKADDSHDDRGIKSILDQGDLIGGEYNNDDDDDNIELPEAGEDIDYQSPLEKFRDNLYASLPSAMTSGVILDALVVGDLRSLYIDGYDSNIRLHDDDVIVLVDSLLSANIPLESLTLRNHRITDVGMKSIGSNLVANSKASTLITYLDLEGNDITNVSSLKLHSNSRCALKYLNLSRNSLGEEGGLQIASGLAHNRRLISLLINNCSITLKALIGIMTSLMGNRRLEVLEIDRPLLDTTRKEESTNHLSRLLLEKTSVLSTLSLRYNDLRDFGVRVLSDAFSRHNYITNLNFEGNTICTAGAEAIASYIIIQERYKAQNPYSSRSYLEILKLSHNIIGDEGAIAIAEAIGTSTSLKKVTLNNNRIGAAGLLAIGESLRQTTSLKSITLFGNDFEQESGSLFYDLIANTLPFKDISIDIEVYIVDGIYMIAESSSSN